MSRSEPAGLESRHDDSTVRRGLLGLDAEAGVHEIDPATRTVYVRGHDGVERVEELGERDVAEWIEYVRQARGWSDLRYTTDPLGDVVKAVTAAEETA